MNSLLQNGEELFHKLSFKIGCNRLPLSLIALVLCTAFLIAGCERAPVKPSDITSDDVCSHCKSPISDVSFASEFITKDGFVRKFDDAVCMIGHARKVGKKNIVGFYAIDAQSKKLFPVEEVQFVRSDKLRTPQNGGIVAFKDPAKADEFVTRFKAEKLKFEDFVK
jgi:hypothetical protein